VEDEEMDKILQTKEVSRKSSEPTSDCESRIQALRGGGQPLPQSARAFFEPRFGYDFSQVRVHTNACSAKLVCSMNARAFTVGRDMVFDPRVYAPDSNAGKKLLAHELTHVVQQSSSAMENDIVYRDTETRPTRQSHIYSQRPRIQNCTLVQEALILLGIREARSLAANARSLIAGAIAGYNLWVRSLAENHFGCPLDEGAMRVILQRYEHIENTLDLKNYSCAICAWLAGGESGVVINPDHHTCALGECPGDDITICLPFGQPSCPPGPVIIHEGAHNAGACLDIRRHPGNYPPNPTAGINNAYSYQYFAMEATTRKSP
jgi:hypothetical protein